MKVRVTEFQRTAVRRRENTLTIKTGVFQVEKTIHTANLLQQVNGVGKKIPAFGLVSSDVFYVPDGVKSYGLLPAHGVLAVEMEAAALYTLAARFDVQAIAICTMTDSLITGEQIAASERQSSLKDMVELSLDVAIGA